MLDQSRDQVAISVGGESGSRPQEAARFYSLVDLFAGCGGLSRGMEEAGFRPVYVNELNDDARATYLANRHHQLGGLSFRENPELHSADVNRLADDCLDAVKSALGNIPEAGISFGPGDASSLDVLAGGPPCQGFSSIGQRRSYAVDKKDLPSNLLYLQMIRVIEALRPRIFLFENVRGLMHATWTRGGRPAWEDIRRSFDAIPGYRTRWKLVSAKDYGVPQNRPRILLVGIRDDICASCSFLNLQAEVDAVAAGFLPRPTDPRPSHYSEPANLTDLLGDLVDPFIEDMLTKSTYPRGAFETPRYLHDPMTPIQAHLRTEPGAAAPRGIGDHVSDQQYSRHSPHVVGRFAMLLRGESLPTELRTRKFHQRALPPTWVDGVGPTVTATSLPDDYVHYCQPRVLTVREWARLQLFPDWYVFHGKRTTGGIRRAGNPREGIFEREVPKYTQIGNAVPVGLAFCVGQHFRRILDDALGRG